MAQFSVHSETQLSTLHPHLREILRNVIVSDDFRVDQGGRTEAEQRKLYEEGRTTLLPPKGRHLIQPDGYAYAADLWPYVNGKRVVVKDKCETADDVAAYCQFAWLMRRVKDEGITYFFAHENITGERWKLRFGIDWDGDGEILTDQTFDDFPHVELVRF